jgi:hypothetical protein
MNTDGIDLGPVTPAPSPAPAPVTPPAVTPKKGCAGALGWLSAAVMAGAMLWLHAGDVLPRPKPPTPAPVPAPRPDGYAGPLWGVYVLPDNPTPAQAALQTDAKVREACEAASVEWRSYAENAAAVKENSWDDDVKAAGGPPVVLWIKGSGSLAAVTRAPDAAKVAADLKAVRGVR